MVYGPFRRGHAGVRVMFEAGRPVQALIGNSYSSDKIVVVNLSQQRLCSFKI
ncbi:MAG: hypothetical protein LBI95_00610 [Holosporales bacterium]|jgi:hypothetical protein|nr:hypothetical protein [Holosporales bacterium]